MAPHFDRPPCFTSVDAWARIVNFLVPDDGRSPFSNCDGRLSIPMHWPKHGVSYHYAQRETEQANSGQRTADETHGSSVG